MVEEPVNEALKVLPQKKPEVKEPKLEPQVESKEIAEPTPAQLKSKIGKKVQPEEPVPQKPAKTQPRLVLTPKKAEKPQNKAKKLLIPKSKLKKHNIVLKKDKVNEKSKKTSLGKRVPPRLSLSSKIDTSKRESILTKIKPVLKKSNPKIVKKQRKLKAG